MSTFKLLKTLTSRRQVLKTGLAALTLSGMSHAVAKEETLKTSNGHSKPKTKKTGSKRLVMLDPGHGGIDTGAIGRNGSQEKHVVLAIAKNVRAILRNHGIDARLTRTGDTFIPLYDRVEIAHKHGADLFMSIHADGFTNPKAAGASVFALSNRGASSAMAKYLSERENRADEVAGKKATDRDHLLQQVLFDLVQTDTIKNSLTLGSHILKKIKTIHKLHSRTTEQAAFVVLKSPSIPSVLVETSFITNPEEERLLGTTALILSRQNLAQVERTPEQVKAIARGGYILKDSGGKPDIILIATGSEMEITLQAAEKLTGEGHNVRVVSLPSTDIFDAQDEAYRESVLPAHVTARVAVEAGIADYWYKYVGLKGAIIGMTGYGESAPADKLFPYFGFTVENIVEKARRVLNIKG